MAGKAEQELISSVRQLYLSPEYSDLTISTRRTDYPVHKAIVCPRSKYFGQECRNPDSKVFKDGILNLRAADPQAAEMVIKYLYNLDYPSLSVDEVLNAQQEGKADVKQNGKVANGHGHGIHLQEDDQATEVPESINSFDEVHEILSMPKKKSKVRKRKKTGAAKQNGEVGSEPIEESTMLEDPPMSPSSETLVDSSPILVTRELATRDASSSPEPTADVKTPVPPIQKSVTIHARVYDLATKLGIKGLTDLALNKFTIDAGLEWNTDEFLRAAKEVYSNVKGDEKRVLRDVVIETLFQHLELLGKDEMRKTMTGLELGNDLVVYMWKHKPDLSMLGRG